MTWRKARNGGRIVEAGDYHVELVAKRSCVEVFLTDASDKPVAPAGFKGVAILVIGGKSVRVALEPIDGTRLSGKAAGRSSSGAQRRRPDHFTAGKNRPGEVPLTPSNHSRKTDMKACRAHADTAWPDCRNEYALARGCIP